MASGEKFGEDAAVDVSEEAVGAVVAEGEAFEVETEEVKEGGVLVVAHGGPLGGVEGEVVGLADGGAPLDPAAGHPGDEGVSVVVAALAPLAVRSAAELGGPEDDGLVEQAAGLQVFQEGGDGLVGSGEERALAAGLGFEGGEPVECEGGEAGGGVTEEGSPGLGWHEEDLGNGGRTEVARGFHQGAPGGVILRLATVRS